MIPKSPPVRETGRVWSKSAPKLLLLNSEGGEPVIYPLVGSEILIGRLDSTDLVLEDPAVSRVHAKIVREGNVMVLLDLESAVGTLVNGSPVRRHLLRSGDVITIASAQMEYRE